jgi:hypothetical protein
MLVLKKELGLWEFEREFRDELKGLPLEAIEVIFNALCQFDLEAIEVIFETVGSVRDYLRFQMQVMSLEEIIHSYGYLMDLEDLEGDELVEVVDEYLSNNTYVLGSFDEDDDIYYIFDEF